MDIDLSVTPGEGLPFAEHQRIRAHGPIFWSASLAGWVVSSYDDVRRVLSDRNHFTSEGTPIGDAFGAEAMLVNDTPLHNKMRAVWAEPVSMSAMMARSDNLRQIAIRLLEAMGTRLKSGETVNIVEVFQDFASEVITGLMDIPRHRIGDLQRWNRMLSDTPALEQAKDSPEYARHLEAKAEVYAFLHEEMRKRRERLLSGEQPEDLVSLMVAAEGRDGITHSIAVDNLINLFLGALDTTAKWLGNIVVVLQRHPHALEEVRADRSLLPQAIEEVMRLETVAQVLLRLVKNDGTELASRTLKAKDRVYVLPGVANHDPTIFEDAGMFDIHRKPKPHLEFGFGMHQCLGVNIARMEALTFIGALLDMFPNLEVAGCDYGSSWALWGPLSFRVRLAQIGDASGRKRP